MMHGKVWRWLMWGLLVAGVTAFGASLWAHRGWDCAFYACGVLWSVLMLFPCAGLDRFDCPECGVGIASDEDGCCAHCGRSVIIVEDGVPTYPPLDDSDEEELGAIRAMLEGREVEDRFQRWGIAGLVYARLHPESASKAVSP